MALLAPLDTGRPEEETLARYRKDVERYPLVDTKRERELLHAIHAGVPGAFDELVQANLRLVMFVARRYRYLGLPLSDLVNEGNIGLMEAARRFDVSRGNSFASYAFYWIRQSIRKGMMDQRSTIRVPVYRQNRLRKAFKEERAASGGTQSRIADEFPESRYRMLSLDARIAGSDAGTRDFSETLADEGATDPFDAVAESDLRGHLGWALSRLDQRQRRVMRLYYGLGSNRRHTLAEIGRQLGFTKEYIRQIRNGALDRLRRPDVARVLGSYIA